jgi:hypothetical protein
MIWLLQHLLSRQFGRPATHRKNEKGRQLADRRRRGVRDRPNHTTARKPGPL